MDRKLYAGSFHGQPPIKVDAGGKSVGIHLNAPMEAWLDARSLAFWRGTNRKGAPMVYGAVKKA